MNSKGLIPLAPTRTCGECLPVLVTIAACVVTLRTSVALQQRISVVEGRK
jgi:hypothetical protein